MEIQIGGGIAEYLGRHTLEIYLFHVYCTAGLRWLVMRVAAPIIVSIFGLSLLGIVVPICFSLLLKKLVLYDLAFKPIKVLYRGKTVEYNS